MVILCIWFYERFLGKIRFPLFTNVFFYDVFIVNLQVLKKEGNMKEYQEEEGVIAIYGAREHNLKNIELTNQRNS